MKNNRKQAELFFSKLKKHFLLLILSLPVIMIFIFLVALNATNTDTVQQAVNLFQDVNIYIKLA